MQFRIFSVPASGDSAAEEELNHFLRANRVVSVSKELSTVAGSPTWFFCVEYLNDGRGTSGGPGGSRRGGSVDYREVLSPEDFAVFVRLRDARKALSQRDAIPVYAICTNEQLAQIAQARCDSASALQKIQGLGEAKVQKYGAEFLKAVAGETTETSDAEPF